MRKSKHCSCCLKRQGLTLVEVIAAIALMGTLLAATITAYGQHARQSVLAIKRLKAIEEMDQLMAAWSVSRRRIPVNASSNIDGSQGLIWKTTIVDSSETSLLLCNIVELAIFDSADDEAAGTKLCSLQILVPSKEE